jgi:putative hydrolase of the HAD superfamily
METLFIRRIRRLSRPLDVEPAGETPRLPPLPGIRAVLFDIYGTCFISGSGDIGVAAAAPKAEALAEALREQGVELDPALASPALDRFHELIRHRHQELRAAGTAHPEIRILDIWEHWRREAGIHVSVPQLAIDVECRLNPVWPMPGLLHTLEQLQAAGLRLGIVSNAQVFTPCLFPALTRHTLHDLGFDPAACVWSWIHQEAKPSTRLYTLALRAFPGLRPEQCLFVGNDMRNDILPAASLGMKTALFAGDRRSLRWRADDPQTASLRPDLLLTRLSQLPETLLP